MRTIQVSTDVFQAIWSARQPGEDDEDAILSRTLGIKKTKAKIVAQSDSGGWVDARSGVRFPEGFEVFRNYKGHELRAKIAGKRWELNGTPIVASTINQLSNAAGIDTENGWMNWNYVDKGEVRKIASLRPTSRVHRRGIRTIRSY